VVVLSLIIPGVGQLYNGRILADILWLLTTPGLWIGTGGLLDWVCHVITAYTPPTPTPAITGCVLEARYSPKYLELDFSHLAV
jgi:hypothetical protein